MISFRSLEGFEGPVSLFPLPNVVFFPNTLLPLHVFEPRYREMVKDSLAHDGLMGMVLLKPGWEEKHGGNPPIFEMACVGQIVHAERLADGNYNVVLHGLDRVRISEIKTNKPYRVAKIQVMREPRKAVSPRRVSHLRGQLFEAFSRVIEPPHWGFTVFSAPHLELGIMADLIASSLPSEPTEKQQILEAVPVEKRIDELIRWLDIEEGKGRRMRIRQLPFVHELARS